MQSAALWKAFNEKNSLMSISSDAIWRAYDNFLIFRDCLNLKKNNFYRTKKLIISRCTYLYFLFFRKKESSTKKKLATADFFLCANALANAYLLKKSEGGSKWLFNSYWVCTRNIIDENLNSL